MASGRRSLKRTPALPTGSDAGSLFDAHGSWLLGSLRRRYGSDLAEDLLQETYLRILRQADPAEIRSPKAYLLQIARNLFIRDYRRKSRRAEVDPGFLWTQAKAEPSSQIQTLVLKEIILGMPQNLREVFLLSRIGGMTNDQIAEQLGIRPKTVEGRMTQALAYCAAQLRD
ncbi:MAG: RNA polymerase sigma factor [Brevundimonas sp.]|nr:MAG: RNA polymerase sigma factor [Brevundimonas sp.]